MTDTLASPSPPAGEWPAPDPAPGPALPSELGALAEEVAALRAEVVQLAQAVQNQGLLIATATGHLAKLGQVLQDVDRLGPVGYALQARKVRRNASRSA